MVSGINVNNYTAAQLLELQKAGMQISDDDIKAALERETQAKNDKESDEANMSYTITDDAGKVNEAEQEVKTAAEYGANLKTILQTLIPKCQTKNDEMAKLQEEMNQFVVTMEDLGTQAETVEGEATTQIADAEASVQAKMEEFEQKQKELEEYQNTIKELEDKEELTEGEQATLNDTTEKADALKTEIADLQGDTKDYAAKIQAQIKETAITKATLLGKSMEDVKNEAQQSLNDAVNANEYADVTIDKGMEAANITEKDAAKDAGFSKRGGFLGWGKRKGDVEAANNMGNTAIAYGEQLGNSSTGVAKTIKQVGSQYGMNFAKTSSIESMVNKEYIDTSKMDEIVKLDDVQGGFFQKIITAKNNQEIVNTIAEEAKKKKAEEENAQKGTTGTTES